MFLMRFFRNQKILISIDGTLKAETVLKELIGDKLPEERRDLVAGFIEVLYAAYVHCHFTYLEINPLVVVRTNECDYVMNV
jgi:ATP citrate (pro-S)-lyase